MRQCAGLIYGPELHHLDHLGPLCCVLEIPLIVTEERLATLAQQFYPDLKIHLWNYLTVATELVNHFDIVFYCMPRDLFDEIFFFAQKLLQKKIHTIWCPHGNSDKGNSIFYMEALKKEEAALVYGKQMIDFLQRKNVFHQLKGHAIIGNFRYQFYLKHKDFYDQLAEREVSRKLPKAEKTLFYAPTWKDYEDSCSFFDAIDPLISGLPNEHNMVVKLHPNLVLQEELQVDAIIDKHADKKNVLFLKDFPAIYPLLNLSDVYIGDMSSIGYDFLTFDRSMFFLRKNSQDNTSLYLLRCGIEILPEQFENIHAMIDQYFNFELRNFSEMRHDVYTYAFGHDKDLNRLRNEIMHLYSVFPDQGLNFY